MDCCWLWRVGGEPCAAPNPCANAATCHPYYQQYVCQCTVDWTGTQCQQRQYLFASLYVCSVGL